MNTNYLIPANSKKSQLYLSLFTGPDLLVLLIGIVISVVLLLVYQDNNLLVLIGLASPALIAVFLVLPIPNYHNVMTLIGNVNKFYTNRRKYVWKGWCACYGDNRENEQRGVSRF